MASTHSSVLLSARSRAATRLTGGSAADRRPQGRRTRKARWASLLPLYGGVWGLRPRERRARRHRPRCPFADGVGQARPRWTTAPSCRSRSRSATTVQHFAVPLRPAGAAAKAPARVPGPRQLAEAKARERARRARGASSAEATTLPATAPVAAVEAGVVAQATGKAAEVAREVAVGATPLRAAVLLPVSPQRSPLEQAEQLRRAQVTSRRSRRAGCRWRMRPCISPAASHVPPGM